MKNLLTFQSEVEAGGFLKSFLRLWSLYQILLYLLPRNLHRLFLFRHSPQHSIQKTFFLECVWGFAEIRDGFSWNRTTYWEDMERRNHRWGRR